MIESAKKAFSPESVRVECDKFEEIYKIIISNHSQKACDKFISYHSETVKVQV